MNQRARALLVSVLFIAGAAAVLCWPSEPSYHGKGLSQWLAQLDLGNPTESSARYQAVDALRSIGTNALPRLTKMLCAKDSPVTIALIKFDRRQSVFHFPVTSASTLQARALQAYGVLGDLAEANVPTLVGILEEERSPQIRACAAFALGQIGRGARVAIPTLRKALQDKDARVSKNARAALLNIQMWDSGLSIRY